MAKTKQVRDHSPAAKKLMEVSDLPTQPATEVERPSETQQLVDLTASKVVELRIEDRVFTLNPPSIMDHAQFFAKVKEDNRKDAAEYLKTLKANGVADDVAVAEFNKRYDAQKMDELSIMIATNSLAGARHYLFACTRKHQPNLSKAEIEKLVTQDNYATVMESLNAIQTSSIPKPAKKA